MASKIQSRVIKPIFAPAAQSIPSSHTSIILVPVNRRIRRTGLRLRAEAQVLQKEVNGKVHGEYTSYGSEDGAWRR